ncbi:MAG: glycosyltransferase family 4 protein [Ruminococcaceae bacterium]|nr:glycosyltransferase family 4 protein [Oscillospiraceae bacterium]
MKILFVVDDYSGGAGNIVQLLSTEYAKENEVSVLLTNHTCEKRYPCEGVRFYELDADSKPNGGLRVFAYQVRWIREKVNLEKPDVIISFLTINNLFVCLGHLFKKIPIIACERVNPLGRKEKFPWNFFRHLAYTRAQILTVQFESFSEMYDGKYKEKCRVTPNYIAPPPAIKDLSKKGSKTRFVSCGRLNDSKQFELLLEMFYRIHKENPDTELRIYGKGPYEDLLKKKISDLGLEDSAFLMGYANGTYPVLLESDVYLMSSKNEGFPNALSEAMAVGLPCVAFRCNDGIDILADYGRRCVVADLNDTAAFEKACLMFASDEALCKEYGERAKEVTSVYSMENVKKTWDDSIREAVERCNKK